MELDIFEKFIIGRILMDLRNESKYAKWNNV